MTAPTPQGLSDAGQKALAVFALCVFYWVFNVLPLMITSMLAIILIPLSGVMTAPQAYALFGNEAVFFILGAFILAAAMMKSGLSTRIALSILRRFGTTPRLLLISVLLLNAIMAFAMSEHAVAAMNFPIVARDRRGSRAQPAAQPLRQGAFSRHGVGVDDRRRGDAARRRARAAGAGNPQGGRPGRASPSCSGRWPSCRW